MKTREQREQRALGWSAVAGLGCTVLVGQMMSWSLPWWAWVISFVLLTAAAFNGWQRSAAQSAILDQQDRQQRDESPPGSR